MNKFVVTYGLREKNSKRQKGEMKKEQVRECEIVRKSSKQCRLWGEDMGTLAMEWSGWQGMNVNIKMSR